MIAEQEETQDFKLDLAQKAFLLKHPEIEGVDQVKLKSELLDYVFDKDLAAVYEHLCEEFGWDVDDMRLQAMKAKNAEKAKELDEKIKDAEENLGETDVRDACLAKANYFADIGDREKAFKAYEVTEEKTPSVGNKIDLVFSQIRLDILYKDWHSVKKNLVKVKKFCDEGGDWERKNKVKVYEAVYCISTRDMKRAADLFLDATATFATPELFPFSSCIFYAVVTSMIALDRVSLKKRVVDAPEILTVIEEVPHLAPLLNSLYNCSYSEFFQALCKISEQIRKDMYLHPHFRYYLREIRVMAYSQFLESYKSVTMKSMAAAFNVGENFLDKEISDFIVAGRLHAKIDKVAGVIETNRPDARNALYQQTIKQGDLLLNRIQKLSKVIDLE
ncbi:hypothetical protein BSKO_07335 [Bryopsis sp. KO-2023]|nr:hypothetical protein BSKO_07335 [Bryopsis sp. KO-2023]